MAASERCKDIDGVINVIRWSSTESEVSTTPQDDILAVEGDGCMHLAAPNPISCLAVTRCYIMRIHPLTHLASAARAGSSWTFVLGVTLAWRWLRT